MVSDPGITNQYDDDSLPTGTRSSSEPRNPLGVPYWETDPATGLPKIDPKTGQKVRWTAAREPDYANQLSMEGYPAGAQPVLPRYFSDDAWKPAQMPIDDMILLQKYMRQSGIIGPNAGQYGVWDKTWADAYGEMLGFANASGLTDKEALGRWGELAAELPSGPGRAPLVVRPSNPDDLKRVFRKAIIDELGQGWDQTRIDSMVAAYQAQETAAQTEAYNMAETGGTVVQPPDPSTFAADQARAEDPTGAQAHDALGYQADFFSMLSGVVD